MSFSSYGRFRQQACFLRRQFLQDGDLPFTDVLSESAVAQAPKALEVARYCRESTGLLYSAQPTPANFPVHASDSVGMSQGRCSPAATLPLSWMPT